MNKLLKIVLGLTIALALVVSFGASARAEGLGDQGPTVLKIQSDLQTLGYFTATPTGYYGPITATSVKAFQNANAAAVLTPNGLISGNGFAGSFTKAAILAAIANKTTTTTTTTTTTGLCPAGYVSVTPAAPLFSSCALAPAPVLTQGNCPVGYHAIVPVAPLMSSCEIDAATTTTTTTTTTTPAPLSPGTGDVTLIATSTNTVDTVIEGGDAAKVLGFKAEASGSDISLNSVKVSLANIDAPNTGYRPTDYATDVTVWMGSTNVGSAKLSDFTKNAYVYSKSISLSNAIVRMGSANKQTFYVTITPNSGIDGTDMLTDDWAILVDNVRFEDGTGFVTTSGDTIGSITVGTFEFNSMALSGDVTTVVSKGSTSPVTRFVTVSTTGSTPNVALLDFKVKATGSTASFDTLNITTALVGGDPYASVVGELRLIDGSGDELATIDGSVLDGSETFTLADTKTIAANTTETFHIVATILDGNNFTSGDTLSASFANFAPEDSSGGTIVDTGSAIGSVQTLIYDVPTMSLVGTPTLALFAHTDGVLPGEEDTYKATIKFNVTAADNAAAYIPQDDFGFGVLGTAGALYTITGGATVTSAAIQYSGSDDLASITEGNTSYRVDAGTSQEFTLTVYLTGNDANGKISLTGLWYKTTPALPTNSPLITGLTSLYTPLVYLAK